MEAIVESIWIQLGAVGLFSVVMAAIAWALWRSLCECQKARTDDDSERVRMCTDAMQEMALALREVNETMRAGFESMNHTLDLKGQLDGLREEIRRKG